MELKNENTDALKTKLHRTKRTMQVLTWIALITLAFFIYGWITNDVDIDFSSPDTVKLVKMLTTIIPGSKCKSGSMEIMSHPGIQPPPKMYQPYHYFRMMGIIPMHSPPPIQGSINEPLPDHPKNQKRKRQKRQS